MKKLLRIAVALLLPHVVRAGDGYTIKGHVSGIVSGYITISERPQEGVEAIHESLPERVRIVDGAFSISGKVRRPGLVQVKISTRTVVVLLENAEYTVQSDLNALDESKFKGGALHDQYNDYLKSKVNPIEYARQHPGLLVSGFLLEKFARDFKEVEAGYAGLSPEIRESGFGKGLAAKLAAFRAVSAGKDMPDFVMTAPDGKKFSVKDLAGKVVVLDFWASWCAPCRAFIPAMREYYGKFQPKGVEFIAVSFDESPDKWRKALSETNMEWKQGLAEGGFGENAPVKNLLNIKSIPHVIVVGKDGKIAAWMDYSTKSQLPEILARLQP